MLSPPIPRRLLPHSITIEPYLRTDGSKAVYGAAVAVSFVRVEAAKQTAQKALGDMKTDKVLIFWDAVNSLPVGMVPKAKDRVTYGAMVMTVRIANESTGSGPGVHHWEVYCGG